MGVCSSGADPFCYRTSKMKLTENFYLIEFRCKDGTLVPEALIPVVTELAQNLQVIRDELTSKIGKDCPININSAYRTSSHNREIGGSTRSQHLRGTAADIWAGRKRRDGTKEYFVSPSDLHGIIEDLIKSGKIKQGGLGKYNSFTHYDIRGTRARW